MSGSFDALASAAVAKAETIDANAASIASLTRTIAELTATNKTLVAQLAAATEKQHVPAPPGFPPIETAHRNNSAGVSCPVRKRSGKWYFVNPQACSKCGRNAVTHMPQDCRGPPEEKEAKDK